MKHVLKILKKSIVPIIFIMAFLVLQALLDLSLPTYTSDIVNNGIVNYGITNSYPDVIRESEYNKLTKYLTNEEKGIVYSESEVGERIDPQQAAGYRRHFCKSGI